jgi:hypothetical protein
MSDTRDGTTAGEGDPQTGPAPGGTVNSQVMDAVAAINAIAAGQAPSSAAAMLNLVSAQTIGLGMYNAIARQQADATIGAAAIAAACARMMGTGVPGGIDLASSQALIAAAEAQARAAILLLKAQAGADGTNAAEATAALERLAAEAAPGTTPGPAPAKARKK